MDRPIKLGLLLAACCILSFISSVGYTKPSTAMQISRQGWFYVGGYIDKSQKTLPMVGQIYVEYWIPAHKTHRVPIVMIHGGLQNGSNFTGTPDGREGWAQYFLRRGYEIYVIDQPARGRSAYNATAQGSLRSPSLDPIINRLIAPERANLWPQARLHTQWPGRGVPGDPIFDQFYASQEPDAISFAAQQQWMRDAGAALLDRIGPAIILTHSQAGAFAWPIAQARPALVRAIVAVEPSGPPVHDIVQLGAPDWFRDSAVTKISGLGDIPLEYEPALATGEELKFERSPQPAEAGHVQCWQQQSPARKLVSLDRIPVLMITSESSYHASYDECTAAYLQQAGVDVDHIRLESIGIRGNGHMMMLEKNSDAIAKVIAAWTDPVAR